MVWNYIKNKLTAYGKYRIKSLVEKEIDKSIDDLYEYLKTEKGYQPNIQKDKLKQWIITSLKMTFERL